jgi:hypothetical protein
MGKIRPFNKESWLISLIDLVVKMRLASSVMLEG